MLTFLGTVLLGLCAGSVYAVVALGFTLLFQSSGAIDFGRGPLVMAGAAIAYAVTVSAHLGWLPGLLAAVIVTGGLGALEYWTSVAPLPVAGRLASSLVSTLGFGVILTAIAIVTFGSGTRGVPALFSSATFAVGNDAFDVDRVVMIPIAVALTLALWAGLQRTSAGKQLRAVAEDADAAALRGINVRAFTVGSFVVAGMLAGLAGVLIPAASGHDILIARAPLYTIYGFVAMVVGGAGSLWGALIGGWLLGIVEAVGTHVDASSKPLFGLAVLVIVLLIRPQGVFASPRLRRA